MSRELLVFKINKKILEQVVQLFCRGEDLFMELMCLWLQVRTHVSNLLFYPLILAFCFSVKFSFSDVLKFVLNLRKELDEEINFLISVLIPPCDHQFLIFWNEVQQTHDTTAPFPPTQNFRIKANSVFQDLLLKWWWNCRNKYLVCYVVEFLLYFIFEMKKCSM